MYVFPLKCTKQEFRRRVATKLETYAYEDGDVTGSMTGNFLFLHCRGKLRGGYRRGVRSSVSLWCHLKDNELRCIMTHGLGHPSLIPVFLLFGLVFPFLLGTTGATFFLTWVAFSALIFFTAWGVTRLDSNLYDYESALLGAANQLCKEEDE